MQVKTREELAKLSLYDLLYLVCAVTSVFVLHRDKVNSLWTAQAAISSTDDNIPYMITFSNDIVEEAIIDVIIKIQELITHKEEQDAKESA